MNKKSRAFTLVELIVVTTILSILGTLGFLSYNKFTLSARESTRISDIASISRALDYFEVRNGYYPDPSDSIDITFSGSLAWKKGTFGDETRTFASSITSIPLDPSFGNQYAYSTTNTRQQYELGFVSEAPLAFSSLISPPVYAAENILYTNSVGNYEDKILFILQSSELYILGIPTLITTSASATVQDILATRSFALKNSSNIPDAYDPILTSPSFQKPFLPGTTGTINGPIIFQKNIEAFSQDASKIEFVTNLMQYYKNSNISSDPDFQNIESKYLGREISYVDALLKNNMIPKSSGEISLVSQNNTTENTSSGDTGESSKDSCISQEELQFLSDNLGENISDISAEQWCSLKILELQEKSPFYSTSLFQDEKLLEIYLQIIFKIPTLETLYFQNISKSFSFPSEIAQSKSLRNIYFSGELFTFPKELSELENIEELFINISDIPSFPREIMDFKNMKRFSLGDNSKIFAAANNIIFDTGSFQTCFEEEKDSICIEGQKDRVSIFIK